MRDELSAHRFMSLIRRAPGLPWPRNLGEERVEAPEVPGGLVAAEAVTGTGHHDGPDQVLVRCLLRGAIEWTKGERSSPQACKPQYASHRGIWSSRPLRLERLQKRLQEAQGH